MGQGSGPTYRYAVGLGSNLGERLDHMRMAVSRLAELGTGLTTSSLYETAPIGGPEQDPYLNAVATFESTATPGQILDSLHQIEAKAERERTVRWGPRTLDLDIVAYSGPAVLEADLEVPHPRAAEREFVLAPLVEVWPEAPVGEAGTAAEALNALADQEVTRLGRRWVEDGSLRPWGLVAIQFVIIVGAALAMFFDGDIEGQPRLLQTIGIVVGVVGAVVALGASRRLGPALTASPEPRSGGQLVTGGLYGWVRHPIYTGVILVMVGASIGTGSVWAVLISLVLMPFFVYKSGYEEGMLRARYPSYGAYADRVRWRLIPFVI